MLTLMQNIGQDYKGKKGKNLLHWYAYVYVCMQVLKVVKPLSYT